MNAIRPGGMSPKSLARLAGLFEALEGTVYTFGQVVVLGKIVVFGDAAKTAANVLAHENLYRLGFACCIAGTIFHVLWAVLFHDLFRVVNRRLSSAALGVILVGCAVQAATMLLYVAPLLLLTGPGAASWPPGQLQALALTLFRWNGYAFDAYLVFFGLWCFLVGILISRSAFMPKILGILLAIDGVGWMLYLAPPFAIGVFPVIAVASAISELPLQLWLLIKGVDSERWERQAAVNP